MNTKGVGSNDLKTRERYKKIADVKAWNNNYQYFQALQRDVGKKLHYFHLLYQPWNLTDVSAELFYDRFGCDNATLDFVVQNGGADLRHEVQKLFIKDNGDFERSLVIFNNMIKSYIQRRED